jgi:DNA-binding NtrC family response regulator/tetratricopeptide (TPR) repeat protein
MDALAELVGISPEIAAVRHQVKQVLASQAPGRRPPPLLFLGETGTGKGLLARACHAAGPRSNGPFVSVNCAAIPEALLEAELFGFDRGAFTGATSPKPGLLETADGGTIFLDEIGLLAEPLQAKLLTVLEERTARRLGSTRLESVDIWIMAATSTNLEEAAHLGHFRKDLYHRLAVVPIWLPPLRQRRDDILLLADRFLARACDDYALTPKMLTPEARAALLLHPWPGNVRELANVMERAALMSGAGDVVASSLGLGHPGAHSPERRRDSVPVPSDYRSSLDRFERAQLLEALEKSGWNVSRAAEQLGVPRNTLRYRITRHGLGPEVPARRRTSAPAPEPASVRQRMVSFLRVALADAEARDTGWALVGGLDLIAEKIETFGGRVTRRDTRGLDGAFGVDPVEDAPGRAANAALAVRRLVDRASLSQGHTQVVIAVEAVICLIEEEAGDSRIALDSLNAAQQTLESITELAPAESIAVGPGAIPHLERHFALALPARPPIVTARDAKDPVRLVGREGIAGPGRPPFVDRSQEVGFLTSAASRTLLGNERTGLGLGGRRLSPFVGRDGEMRLLLNRIDHVRASRRGAVVGIKGEPGAGKSRILFELRQRLADMHVSWLEGHCASHATAAPYSMVRDLLVRAWDLDGVDSVADLSALIERRLGGLGLSDGVPYVLALFGVPNDALRALSREALKARTFEYLRRVLLAPTRSGLAVVLLEDLHWADEISREFLGTLVDALPGGPLLIVATSRPGVQSPWLERSWASQLALPSLSARDSYAVAQAVLADVVVAPSLIERIVVTADGNPFFLEELAWAIAGERDALEGLRVSDTVTGALAARMDRLPAEARHLLETAAVLGREAPLRLLEAVSGSSTTAMAVPLRQLVDAEFLYEQPGPSCVFKHALTQDVAYSRLDADERERLHTRAGEALEHLHAERLDGVIAQLAHHWSRTTHHAKAVSYLGQFADTATASYALDATLAVLDDADAHARALPPGSERDIAIVELLARRGLPLIQLGRLQELHDRLVGASGHVEGLDDHRVTGPYYVFLSFALDHLGDRAAGAAAKRALEVAERWNDSVTAGKAHFVLALEALWCGVFEDGIGHAERGIPLLDGTVESWWFGHLHWILGVNATILGRFDLAVMAGQASIEVGVRCADPRLQSYGRWILGWSDILQGHHDAALVMCREAYDLAPDPLCKAVAAQWLGLAYIVAGHPETAIPLLRDAVEQYGVFHFPALEGWAAAWLSDALRAAHRPDEAISTAERACEVGTTAKFAYAVGLADRALGEAARDIGDLEKARRHLTSACDTLTRIDARPDASLASDFLAAVCTELGDPDAAAQHLVTAARLRPTRSEG